VLQVDAGDMLWSRQTVNTREREQRRIKAELLLDGARQLGVDALAVGDGELAFGLDFLVSEANKRDLPFVSANLAGSDGQLVFPATLVVKKAGLRIGLTSVLSDQLHVAGGRLRPSVDALREAVAQLREREKVDLVVLLSHLGFQVDRTLPEQVAGIDLIFGGHSRSHQEEPLIVGTTAVFQAGSRGKHLGEVTLSLREGASGWADPGSRSRVEAQRKQLTDQIRNYEEQLATLGPEKESQRPRLERVVSFSTRRLEAMAMPPADDGARHLLTSSKIPLDRGLADDPEMKRLVDAALDRLGPEGRSALSGVGTGHEGHDHSGHEGHDHGGGAEKAPAPKKRMYGDFVGAEACRSCHQAEFKDWSTTPHARAYTTLVKERRHFDLDCWSCHVTGAEQGGGPSGPYDVGPMRNVQCEACHGPGRQHISKPSVDMVRLPSEAHCKTCHDDDQTEGRFEYLEYLPKIDHRN